MATSTRETETAPAVRVSRTIRASRQRVFRAWTEPELLMRWFVGPDDPMRIVELDLRPGGRYRLEGTMQSRPWKVWGTYREVVPNSRLVYTWTWDNDAELGEPLGKDTLVTVEFLERGAETEVIVTHEKLVTERARTEHANGWVECLDRVAALSEKEQA
jgi:uncharacterized protein YndB with AHSA1/START domain